MTNFVYIFIYFICIVKVLLFLIYIYKYLILFNILFLICIYIYKVLFGFFSIFVYFSIVIPKIGRKKLFIKMNKLCQLDRHNFKWIKIEVTCCRFQLMVLIKIVSLSAIIF